MNTLRKVSSTPHIRGKLTTNHLMLAVVISLLPACAFGIHNFGIRALWIILITVASTVLTELFYQLLCKKPVTIGDFSAVVTGILLALNLPVSVPWWLPVIGGIFAILVVKQLFGGLGQNFMNPALGARCFLLISFTSLMTDFECDAYTGPTPLALLKTGETTNVYELVLGRCNGTIGETSMIALIMGACFLLLLGVIDLRVPGTYLLSFVILLGVFGPAGFELNYIVAHLAAGGLMLGAFFMATDYVTRPVTVKGQYLYGALLGLLTFVFRVYGSSAEGVSYAIIIGNLLVPLIEKVSRPRAFGIRRRM